MQTEGHSNSINLEENPDTRVNTVLKTLVLLSANMSNAPNTL